MASKVLFRKTSCNIFHPRNWFVPRPPAIPGTSSDTCGQTHPATRHTRDVFGHVRADAPEVVGDEQRWREGRAAGALCNRRDLGVLTIWTFHQPSGRSGRSE